MKLSKIERETHFWKSEADNHWYCWTEVRSMINLLKKRGYKQLSTGEFELPSNALTIRSFRSSKTLVGIRESSLKKAREAKAGRNRIEEIDP